MPVDLVTHPCVRCKRPFTTEKRLLTRKTCPACIQKGRAYRQTQEPTQALKARKAIEAQIDAHYRAIRRASHITAETAWGQRGQATTMDYGILMGVDA